MNPSNLKPLSNANYFADIAVPNTYIQVDLNQGTLQVHEGSLPAKKQIGDSNTEHQNHFTTYNGKLQLKKLGGSQAEVAKNRPWYQ
ncbi:hypothetical protein PROFUN_06379 [Planoprotostelium fungivorum]|uniref:Uncharacterized protein n=1 Tax=Planoprotostelium fungivorum TaxID=1890364 RepID=A0A2P6NNQ2_9EUKA|nr:hypothetical protein PROFUN_06379 [Planoprotostelium fungivorum]